MKKLLLLLYVVFYSNALFSAATANQLDPKPFTYTKTNIARTAILEAAAAAAIEELEEPTAPALEELESTSLESRRKKLKAISRKKIKIERISQQLEDDPDNEDLQKRLKNHQDGLKKLKEDFKKFPKIERKYRQEELREIISTNHDPKTVNAAERQLLYLQTKSLKNKDYRTKNHELTKIRRKISTARFSIKAIQEKLKADSNDQALKKRLSQLETNEAELIVQRDNLIVERDKLKSQQLPLPPDDLSSDDLYEGEDDYEEDAPPPLDELSSEDDSEFEDAIPLLETYQGPTQEELAARAPAAIPATPEQLAAAAQLVRLYDDLEPMPAATGSEAAQALAPAYAFPPGTTFFYLVTPEEAYPAAQAERPLAAAQPSSGPQRHICDYCGKSYNHKANLTKHIQAKHSQPK